jgi:hypothetical protein
MNRAIAPEHATLLSPLFTLVGFFAAESKFQQPDSRVQCIEGCESTKVDSVIMHAS